MRHIRKKYRNFMNTCIDNKLCKKIQMQKRGAIQEHKEHPELSMQIAEQIARDHLKENPDYYIKKVEK